MSSQPSTMRRLVKESGVGNIQLAESLIPGPESGQILVRVRRSLISRGSEIGGRYRKNDPVSPEIMGYSAAGEIVEIGPGVVGYEIGQPVVVVAPHADYVLGESAAVGGRAVTPIPEGVSFEQAVFHPLATGGQLWTDIAEITNEDDVVVVGLGLVGNLVLQAAVLRQPKQLIGVDAIASRCELASRVGAESTIDVAVDDSVERVRALTGGEGASLVMECVGGPAGVRSFEKAVRMTRPLGRIHLIALYHEQPLSLDSQAIQRRMIIGGYHTDLNRTWRPAADAAMRHLQTGAIQAEPLITHQVSPGEAPAAFTLLHDHPSEALGIVINWDH